MRAHYPTSYDPIVLVHARAELTGGQGVIDYLDADVREPEQILRMAESTLDLERPVAVLLLGVLHFLSDADQARSVVARLLEPLPAGSHVAIAHACNNVNPAEAARVQELWNAHAHPEITFRSQPEIVECFGGMRLLEPGVVAVSHWRPDHPTGEQVNQFGGLAVKP